MSLIPRFLRRKTDEEKALAKATLTREALETRRTGSTIAILGLLVGSFAINVISLRREMTTYSRNTETKLELLREVVKRVKAGEQIDVKKLLGTGDRAIEQEWEEMVQELERYNESDPSQKPKPMRKVVRKLKEIASPWLGGSKNEADEGEHDQKKPDAPFGLSPPSDKPTSPFGLPPPSDKPAFMM